MKLLSICFLLLLPLAVHGQLIFTGEGNWSDEDRWDVAIPGDGDIAVINGDAVISEDIASQNSLAPGRFEIGTSTTGNLTVAGGTLSGAHGGGSGIFVGVGAGGDGTLIIEDGAAFRSQGGGMNVRIGDDEGGVGFVSVAGELLNYKFFELLNGTLEMQPTGINAKFNQASPPSVIGPNGILSYVINGDQVGSLKRSNTNGLQVDIDNQATLKITLEGNFAVGDSWLLMDYTRLDGQFAQGTSFVNAQGYAFDINYGSGSSDTLTVTLMSLDARPQIEAFASSPVVISSGDDATLSWTVDKFSRITIDQGVGDVTSQTTNNDGSVVVSPTETTDYLMTVDFNGIIATQSLTVVVDSVPLVQSLTTTPELVAPGEEVTLRWDVAGADTVTIEPGQGAVDSAGQVVVSPTETTSYKLTATNANGSTSRDLSVTVNALEAAIIHLYEAGADNQTDGALKDAAGTSNWDVKNGELAEVTSERATIVKAHRMVEFNANTGCDNGNGYPDANVSYELWVRAGEFASDTENQIVFETGGSGAGTGVLITSDKVRLIHSQGGARTIDIAVSLLQINFEQDYLQIMVTLNSTSGTATLAVRGAGGGQGSVMGSGAIGSAVGRATLFSHSNFNAGIAGALGGSGGLEPEGATQFTGEISVLKVYDRVLETAEIEQAFKKLAVEGDDDADNDGLLDFWEVRFFGNTNASPNQDTDNDGLTNLGEFNSGALPNTADSDEDGLLDGEEVNTYNSNPIVIDSDGDGLSDGREVNELGTAPGLPDTDVDGFRDDVELALKTDPTSADSAPPANAILLTRAPAGGEDWNSPDIWADGQAPSADKQYVIVGSLSATLPTPATNGPEFQGGSVVLAGGSTLNLRHDGVASIPQLIVRDDASIVVSTMASGLSGELMLEGDLRIDQRVEGAIFNLGSKISGIGSMRLLTDAETLNEATLRLTGPGSDYQADWAIEGGSLEGVATGSLGTGNITIRQGGLSANYNVNLPAHELVFVGGDFALGLEKALVVKHVRAVSPDDEAEELLSLPDGDYSADSLVNDVGFAEDQVFGEGILAVVGDTGDSDNDGLLDRWETETVGDLSEDAAGDSDEDGLTGAQEFAAGSDPSKADSDDDGLADGQEVNVVGSDPNKSDTDDDGLSDRDEVEGATPSSPLLADTDGDGRSDLEEVTGDPMSDPSKADTDGDGFSDSFEVAQGSDPQDATDLPADPLGEPTETWTILETLPTFDSIAEGADLRDAAFRVFVDFEAKPEGERELIFETGGATIGHSVVYEAPNNLVYRANGNNGLSLAVVEHTLTQEQLDAGTIEVIWSYDVQNTSGSQTIALFLDGVSVGSVDMEIGGDWSGTNAAAFGVASVSLAGDGANNVLTAVDFESGTIDANSGLAFFADRIFVGAGGPVDSIDPSIEISSIVQIDGGFRITWTSPATGNVDLQYAPDLRADSWEMIASGVANGTVDDTEAARASGEAGFYRLRITP